MRALRRAVKMETRHPIEGSFGNEFSSIYNCCGVTAACSRKTSRIFAKSCTFKKNDALLGNLLKFCSERIHRDTDVRVVFKFCEIWPTGNQKRCALFA